jgi:hypothetical protein
MLWVPQKGVVRVEHNTGAVGTATPGTSVTTGSTSSTKGTPAQLIASTAFDAYWVTILASNYGNAATASQGAMDILTGAATEDILIPNLLMGHCGSIAAAGKGPKRWDFPLYIPSGTRIAVQAAGARTSTAFRVWIYLYGGDGLPGHRVGTRVTTYGMGTVPDGTSITPGASAAEGSWTQITASTSQDHFAFLPSFQATGDTTLNNRLLTVDLGVGAATEEQIMEGYWFATDGGEFMDGPYPSMPCFHDVPASTRLVMRASNSGANDGGYNGVIHAVS